MALTKSSYIPRATYRVQLHHGFQFADLQQRLPYLTALGIGELYLSPIFTAAPGSLHGYDVCDYRSINPELGGHEGFRELAHAAHGAGMGIILDFVPNHMGIAGPLNAWWRDVLENGRQSPYADFFDIHWNVSAGEERPRVLIPMLEDHYGNVLEQGKIRVECSEGFALFCQGIALPMSPRSYAAILQAAAGHDSMSADDRTAFKPIADELARDFQVSPSDPAAKVDYVGRITAAKAKLKELMASRPGLREAISHHVEEINGRPGDPASFAALHAIVEDQHYRLARWQTGAHEINYRRFFAIDSLVGLRMERADVFDAAHELLRELIREGLVDGLRIDHIDGLREPEKYIRQLQATAGGSGERPFYVAVEKILAGRETLPPRWLAHGATGYEFIPQLSGLLVDPSAEKELDRIYAEFTGQNSEWSDTVYATKRMIISVLFANAVNNLGLELTKIVSGDWRWRDLTRHELTTAVAETMVCLRVYRTYREGGRVCPQDQAQLERACDDAIGRNPLANPQPFEFLRDLLIGTYPPSGMSPDYEHALGEWVATFQQYTGAVMAKSVEDTAYYTFCRLIALNEVGGDPGQLGTTVEAFHDMNRRRLLQTPLALLTTSTHDTKLSEDVRARLYGLSEIPHEWEKWVREWHEHNSPHRTRTDTGVEAPDALDEYRFYQVLLGAWPLSASGVDDAFRQRLREHFRKAVDEAKRHTSQMHPNESYYLACDRFVDCVTSPRETAGFLESFTAAARRIARIGMVNSLIQVVLKYTAPGVPDLYQGNEVWDFSLVDPDNRRAVNFDERQDLVRESEGVPLPDLLKAWESGAIKLRTTERLLGLRRTHAHLFAEGSYEAVRAEGEFSAQAVAFLRSWQNSTVLVVVPHLSVRVGLLPLGLAWGDTAVSLPDCGHGWRDVCTERFIPQGTRLLLRDLFVSLPFAVLEKTIGST